MSDFIDHEVALNKPIVIKLLMQQVKSFSKPQRDRKMLYLKTGCGGKPIKVCISNKKKLHLHTNLVPQFVAFGENLKTT